MSGPKVFHVVTREELVARCEAHLRQLDAAIAEWTKACKRKGAADAQDTEAVASRRDALRRMLKEGPLFRTPEAGSGGNIVPAGGRASADRAGGGRCGTGHAEPAPNRPHGAHAAGSSREVRPQRSRRPPPGPRIDRIRCQPGSRHSACIRASGPGCRQRCGNRPATRTGFPARARRKTCHVGRLAGEPAPVRRSETPTCGSTGILPNFPPWMSTRRPSRRGQQRSRANFRLDKRCWRTAFSLTWRTP